MGADIPSLREAVATAAPPQGVLTKGVKGIDLAELVLAFARNKLVFQPKGAPEHYTLHFGPTSKVVDFHKTTPGPDGTSDHLRLFSITHARFLAMMEELAQPLTELLMGLARPLNPAWMEKHRVGAIVGLLPTDAEVASITHLRRGRLAIDSKKLAARAWAPAFLDELYDVDGQIFTLFLVPKNRAVRKIGYGFALTDTRRKRRLVWIPDHRVARAMQRGVELLEDAAAKYGRFEATNRVRSDLPKKRPPGSSHPAP